MKIPSFFSAIYGCATLFFALAVIAAPSQYARAQSASYSKTIAFLQKQDAERQRELDNNRKTQFAAIDANSDLTSLKVRELSVSVLFGDFQTADTIFPEVNKKDLAIKNKNGDNIFLLNVDIRNDDWHIKKMEWIIGKKINLDVMFYDGEYGGRPRYQTFIEYIALYPIPLRQYLRHYSDKVDIANPSTGQTALGLASRFGRLESMQVLLACNASIDLPGVNGETPLIQSVLSKEYAAALFLVSHGADANVEFVFQDKEYKNILDYILHAPYSHSDEVFIESLERDGLPVLDTTRNNMLAKIRLKNILGRLHQTTNR